MTGYNDDLRLAHVMADAADDLTMRRFKAVDLKVETKPDLTPVSDADQAVEETIRGMLKRARSRDAVIGEEFGKTGYAARSWIIDPIDGTKNYVRGVPVWATLIALMDHGRVVVSVVSAPALGRRWWAAQGGGAWTGKSLTKATRCRVSSITSLQDASFSFSDIEEWEKAGRLDDFLGLNRACWRSRGFGDFWSHMMVAEGAVDLSAEPDLSPWDIAALTVIVEEAGGLWTDLSGVPDIEGTGLVCTNGALHGEVLKLLGGGPVTFPV